MSRGLGTLQRQVLAVLDELAAPAEAGHEWFGRVRTAQVAERLYGRKPTPTEYGAIWRALRSLAKRGLAYSQDGEVSWVPSRDAWNAMQSSNVRRARKRVVALAPAAEFESVGAFVSTAAVKPRNERRQDSACA